MAKALNVPVMALAQLNRGSEMHADRQPRLSDLREAGVQEQDADVVALMHRDLSTPEGECDLRLFLAKNRHGPPTNLQLVFRGHFSRADDPRGFNHQEGAA